MKKKRQQEENMLFGAMAGRGIEALRKEAAPNPAAMTSKKRREVGRRRVVISLPEPTQQAVREIAEVELTTLSQASMALQMLGLVYLIVYRGGLYFLPGWRKPTSHPRIPFLLGMPQAWLDFIAELSQNREGYRAPAQDVIVVLGTNDPIVHPSLTPEMIDSGRGKEDWWKSGGDAAAALRVPKGYLLGFLETAGVLAYVGQFSLVNDVFGEENRELARNGRDVFHLTRLKQWAPVLGEMLVLGIQAPEGGGKLIEAARAFSDGAIRRAGRILTELRASMTHLSADD